MNQLLSSWLTSLSLSVDQHSCFSMATCWRSLNHLFSLQFSCTSWSYYSHDSLLNYKENMYRRFVFRRHWNSRPIQRYCQMRAQRLKTKPWIIATGGVVHLQVFPLFFPLLLLLWDMFWTMVFSQMHFGVEVKFELRCIVVTRNRLQ